MLKKNNDDDCCFCGPSSRNPLSPKLIDRKKKTLKKKQSVSIKHIIPINQVGSFSSTQLSLKAKSPTVYGQAALRANHDYFPSNPSHFQIP